MTSYDTGPRSGEGWRDPAIALPVVLGRSREDRVRGLVALVPCLGLGAAGFVATLALTRC